MAQRKRSSVAKKSAPARRKSAVKSRRAKSVGSVAGVRGRKVSARKGGLVKRIASAMSR